MTSSLTGGFQGALTSVFTPAASCVPFNNPNTITSIDHTFYHQYHAHTECQPSKTIGGYYSPGVCPSGYNRASGPHASLVSALNDQIYSVSQTQPAQSPLATNEFVDFCCPAGYDASDLNWCTSTMRGDSALAVGMAHTTVTGLVTGVARADVVQVRFRPGDVLPQTTSYSRPSASTMASSLQVPTATASSTISTSSEKSHHHVNVLAILASVISGCLVLVFIIVVWMVIHHGNQKRSRKLQPVVDDPPPYSSSSDVEKNAKEKEIDVDTTTMNSE